jgi:hypothetical protein
MTPEGRIKAMVKRELIKILKEYPGSVWSFMPVQYGYGKPALDYLWCVSGHFVAIETKAPGKVPTPRQALTMGLIGNAGGSVFVVSGEESLAELVEFVRNVIAASR